MKMETNDIDKNKTLSNENGDKRYRQKQDIR